MDTVPDGNNRIRTTNYKAFAPAKEVFIRR